MLVRAWKRIAGVLLLPSGLGGAFLGLTVFQLNEGNHRLVGLVVGWLYGVSVWGLMRLLPVPRGRSWLAGILAGPVPLALLMPTATPADERGGVLLAGCVLGCLLGLLEAADSRRRGAPSSTGGRPAGDPAGLEPPGRGDP